MSGFKFMGVKDYGSTSCPHCGAEGRYIYTWEEDGKVMSAMAGCFKVLTNHVSMSDLDKIVIGAHAKQQKGKALNGWEKNILRLLKYKEENKYPGDWCDKKIVEVMHERQTYLNKYRH